MCNDRGGRDKPGHDQTAEDWMPSKDKAGRAFPAGRGDNAKPHQPPTTRITPHAFGFRPGIDLDKLGKLADELEDEIYAAEQRRP